MSSFRLMFTGVPFGMGHQVFQFLRDRKVSFEYAKDAATAVDSLFVVPVDILIIGAKEHLRHSAKLTQFKQQHPGAMIVLYVEKQTELTGVDHSQVEGVVLGDALSAQVEMIIKQYLFSKRLVEIIQNQQHTLEEQRKLVDELNHKIEGWVGDLQDDVSVINGIQNALMPKRYPSLKSLNFQGYFRAGAARGGDMMDVFAFKNRPEVGIAQMDSVGHSVTASLLAALLKIAVTADSDAKGELIQVMVENARHTLSPLMQSAKRSAVLRFGVVDPKKLTFDFADFGFGTFAHYQAGNGRADIVNMPANSAFSDTSLSGMFKHHTVQLRAGDCLLLPTDGCAAVLPEMLQVLTHKAMTPILELRNELAYLLRDPDMKANDDAAFVLVQVSPHALKLLD